MLFRAPDNTFAYTIVHPKYSFVHACILKCTSPSTFYKDKNILEEKVNLRSIPLTINPETSLGIQTVFIGNKTADASLVYPEPTIG